MAEKQIIEFPIVGVMTIEVSSDLMLDSVITFAAEAEANIALRLPPTAMAELENLLARASQEQAKLLPKQYSAPLPYWNVRFALATISA